ncbi:hypothetical protein ACHAP3_007936 [Botrytis cinerea]
MPPMKKLQHADHLKLQAEHLYYLFNFPLFLVKCILNLTTAGDVGGQKTLRSYWRNYFEKTDALIWVVDATDRLRIEDCKEELHALLQEERLSGASLLVFANKTDVNGCMTKTEIKDMLVLDEIRTHKWHIINCSAITGENLDEGLTWVVEDSKERLFLY